MKLIERLRARSKVGFQPEHNLCAEAADRIEALEAFVADVADSLTDGSVIPNPSWESDDAEWLLDRANVLQGGKQQ